MDPATAGIAAGGGLLGTLLQMKAAAEQRRQDREFQAIQQGFEAQKEGAGNLAKADQNAFAQLLAAYKGALGV